MIPEDPRSVLRRHGLTPKRSWGQNFLINLSLAERMAATIAETGVDRVIEIGAGVGTLTTALAAQVPAVVAIERDPDLAALLEEERVGMGGHVEVVRADAATFDFAGWARDGRTAVVGNLPYNLTGRLIRRIVDARASIDLAMIMVQIEVAERLVASPASSSYGVSTVTCQAWMLPTILWRVSPGSFFPRPKVSSAVVRLDPLVDPRVGAADVDAFETTVHAAFAARRKTLRNTLGARFGRERALAALEAEAIDPGRRAETLSVEQLASLAKRLHEVRRDQA